VWGIWPCIGEKRNAFRLLVGKPAVRKRFGKLRGRREDYVKMVLKEMASESVDGTHLDQDRHKWRALVNKVSNFLLCPKVEEMSALKKTAYDPSGRAV
jgi:hypothetical protein